MRRKTRIFVFAAMAAQGLFLFSGCGYAGMSRMMSAMWNWMA